jgi:transcriptional regulator with XRE-family HTH domain
MEVNVKALKRLAKGKNWSLPEMSEKMGLNYTFLYRVIHGQRNPGRKFFKALMFMCMNENLDFEDYVIFTLQPKENDE